MKKERTFTLAGAVLTALALFVSGCYTQFATTEGEEEYSGERSYAEEAPAVDDSTAAQGYTEERHRVYFDYYYPSLAFSVGYFNPWYWGVNWWYTPYWTPYYYGYGWYAPIAYPGWYYPYYGYPYYPYYPHGGVYVSAPYATRTFGNTRSATYARSGGTTRDAGGAGYGGGSMMDNVGRAAVRSGGSSPARGTKSGVRTPSAPTRLSPTSAPRGSSGSRSAGSVRSTDRRTDDKYRPGRSYTPSYVPRGGDGRSSSANPFPSYSPGPRSGGENRSGGAPSYTPSAPRSSAPPASSGGGAHGGGGGSRGGNRR